MPQLFLYKDQNPLNWEKSLTTFCQIWKFNILMHSHKNYDLSLNITSKGMCKVSDGLR